jgi:hypothetical protein
MQRDQELANALVGYPKSFDDLASPHRSIQQFKQAPPAAAGQEAGPPRPFRNGVEAAGFSALCRMPPFGLITFGKSQLGQHAQRRHSLCEVDLCLNGDLRLSVSALSERDQAGGLRPGEEKISGAGHAAAPPVDSLPQYAVLALARIESIRRYPQNDRCAKAEVLDPISTMRRLYLSLLAHSRRHQEWPGGVQLLRRRR